MSKQEPATRRTDRAENGSGDLTRELHPRKPLAGESRLADALNEMVAEGELYEKLPDNRVHCFACGHHCKISDGGRGVCQVRYNIGGKLFVPRGYVVALNSDPIEKKPFFHVYPGSDALTFGMLGCDLHCSYCFTGDTPVVTGQGPRSFAGLFEAAPRRETRPDAEIAFPESLQAVAASGTLRKVEAIFKHPYRGKLAIVEPFYLPAIRCTPDHRIYATDDPAHKPEPIQARQLTEKHYLAVPRKYDFSTLSTIDPVTELASHEVTYRVPWGLTVEQRQTIAVATERGDTSREIGTALGLDPSYVRDRNEKADSARQVIETNDYYLIPLRSLRYMDYDGPVYNMQVEEEHNYLAGFLLVSNCQNWDISQALRDANAGRPPTPVTANQVVQVGKRYGARVVASSYNEPLITSEWAVEIMQQANAAGLLGAYVSNGNATREVLEYIRPFVSAYKIDLKSMRDKSYRALGVPMQNVLDGIHMVHDMGFWLEIVTLIVPGFNDTDAELRDAAEFIASVSRDIPWHVTAFHSDYRMQDHDNTPARTLLRACEIGRAAGLNYVYAGNIPGNTGGWENTYCPQCHATLIERMGFAILDYHLTAQGTCPQCGTSIPGIWPSNPDEVQRASANLWFTRRPKGV